MKKNKLRHHNFELVFFFPKKREKQTVHLHLDSWANSIKNPTRFKVKESDKTCNVYPTTWEIWTQIHFLGTCNLTANYFIQNIETTKTKNKNTKCFAQGLQVLGIIKMDFFCPTTMILSIIPSIIHWHHTRFLSPLLFKPYNAANPANQTLTLHFIIHL